MDVTIANNLDTIVGFFGSTIVSSGILFLIFKTYIKNIFQKSLDKNKAKLNEDLEGIKSDFNKEIEKMKFRQSLVMKEFDLFATKKYDHYPEMYTKIETCIGEIMSLGRLELRFLTFDNVSKIDIENRMKELEFTQHDINEILNQWDDEKSTAVDKFNHREKRIKYNSAIETYFNAWNYFLFNRFFFSPELDSLLTVLFEKLNTLKEIYDPERYSYTAAKSDEERSATESVNTLRADMLSTIRRDLNNGSRENEGE